MIDANLGRWQLGRTLWLLLVLAPAVWTGCGYALVGRASTLPADVRSVYLRPFENRTTRSQVDQILTRALADELVARKRFTLASSPGEANAEIMGTVLNLSVNPVVFDPAGRATEYEIVIAAQVRFHRLRPGAGGGVEPGDILWSNERYLFRQNYPVEISAVDYFDRENLALDEVAEDFAQTMASDLLEGF